MAVLAATATSAGLIAVQMAGKATRDALFLSTFDVQSLPAMVMASSLVALALAFAAARVLPRVTPARLLPIVLAASGVLLLGEWALLDTLPRAAVVLLYLHYGGLGALLISGFWSLVSERFDPRSAKRHVGRIAAAGTLGGVAGGGLAAGVAAWLSVPAMLPLLAMVQFACAALVRLVHAPAPPAPPDESSPASAVRTIAETPYLRGLVVVVLLVSLSEGLIDYVFKAGVRGAYPDRDALLRVFAVFYTAVGVLSAVVQLGASRAALQRLGLTPTVALMPGVVAVGSVATLAAPGMMSALLLRGTEAVLRNSFYRAGYELLFTPLPKSEKRASKTLIDVGALRMGDVAGGGLVQLLLLATGGYWRAALLAASAVLAAGAAWVALRLRAGYVAALERNLVSQAIRLDPDEIRDLTTRTAMLQSVVSLGLPRPSMTPAPPAPAPRAPADPSLDRVARLRAPAADDVRAALAAGPVTPDLAGHVIRLLARDDVLPDATRALRPHASAVTGQLIDRLLDPDEDFAIRRRIPRLLAEVMTDRAVDGLLRGLADERFEVRYRCGRALLHLHESDPSLGFPPDRVYAAVLNEVAVDRELWESRRLIDAADDVAPSPLVDEVLRERASRSLEHVFTLLALVLSRQHLTIAFRALHTSDPMLRGTALEYLETALPELIRARLWPYLEDRRPARPGGRPAGQVVQDLLRSRESIALNLEELRRRSGA
ncbi:MAG TPA: Npt1/Npt2 family nucleotide transporter [Gemmatimonadales bacterium]|nr:Npt1/Npt2 family nucleotide transporter [Gemmatimonadales bacterium]